MILAIDQPQARRRSHTSCPTIQGGDLVLLLHGLQQAWSSPQKGRYGPSCSTAKTQRWFRYARQNMNWSRSVKFTWVLPSHQNMLLSSLPPTCSQTDTFCGDKPITWRPTWACLKMGCIFIQHQYTPKIVILRQKKMINSTRSKQSASPRASTPFSFTNSHSFS